MIISFKHKGLERFYRTGKNSGIQAAHIKRIQLILSNLDQAESASDMDLPGLRLRELKGNMKGNMKGVWSVVVNGNWRITFKFIGTNAELINYEDYH
jgi:toxin HigB-1